MSTIVKGRTEGYTSRHGRTCYRAIKWERRCAALYYQYAQVDVSDLFAIKAQPVLS